ncbi:MAG: 50S ribosomal protein L10 [Anaerolineae bacterium]|nr:50S ribosomal protein L10 [Anaerolineae bacterium]
MAISKNRKEGLVQEYADELGNSSAVFFAHYSGMTVSELERVRDAMAREETRVEVVRNRLMAIAAESAGKPKAVEILDGPTLAVFCLGDPTSPAKTLSGFHREIDRLVVYGGLLGDESMGVEQFQQLATLPGREELLGKVVYTLQGPITGFVGVLSGVLRSLLYVLQARVDQLEGSTSSEAA